MASWKEIPEIGLCLNFHCEKCKAEVIGLGPKDLIDNGQPWCIDCDQKMVLESCEVDHDLI